MLTNVNVPSEVGEEVRRRFIPFFAPVFQHGLFAFAVSIFLAQGCRHESSLKLHYLPAFVPGIEHVLPPIPIAVLPATGTSEIPRLKVGAIYDADDAVGRPLYVENLHKTVTDAVLRALADAGAKPVADGSGVDFKLRTQVESVSVVKRYSPEQTVHGQYFSMHATMKLKFTLATPDNPKLFSVETTGLEEEPPEPVGGEVFLPLETEPAESLSVALSRAVGSLIASPEFRKALRGNQSASLQTSEVRY
jgi:hypothetical protein